MFVEEDIVRWGLTADDMFEVGHYLTLRWVIQAGMDSLNIQERAALMDADDAFRRHAVPCLDGVGLLAAYHEWGANHPTQDWWWHL